MYGSINYDNKYELKIIETNCSSCGSAGQNQSSPYDDGYSESRDCVK